MWIFLLQFLFVSFCYDNDMWLVFVKDECQRIHEFYVLVIVKADPGQWLRPP